MLILNYLLYYLIIIPISLLPFPLLYLFSDFLFLILYYLIPYRKKVVLDNLRNSFPEKSELEINLIAKKFYRHLCDLIVESLKGFTISEKQIKKRMTFINPEILNNYFSENKSVLLGGGHYNNWEWIAVAIDMELTHQTLAIYKTLSNKFFDEKMRATRQRFGVKMISTRHIKKVLIEYKQQPTVTIFAVDQSPGNLKNSHWMNFLNQDTAVMQGLEQLAKEHNYPVVWGAIYKIKRGHYQVKFTNVTATPLLTAQGEIIEKVMHMLEADIAREPQYWLWTHRRWKHKRNKV